ncbi:MAG: radical SAM protein [Candidatus Omnitrophota bacterium]
MNSVDVIVVNPSNKKHMYGKLGESLAGIEPPLWGGLLAGFLREKGFSVKIIDADALGWGPEETVKQILHDHPRLVAIGAVGANPSASSTPKMIAVKNVLALLKQKDSAIQTVLYGIHPSALPERTLKEEQVDYLARGEAFYPVSELLSAIKADKNPKSLSIKGLWYLCDGQVVDGGWADVVSDLDRLPFVAWDLLPMDKYRAHNWHCFGHLKERSSYAIIYTSLGCPYNCRYCNIHALYSGRPGIRFRSPERAIEEIDYLVRTHKIKHIKFLDEIFVLKKDRLYDICDRLIERNYNLNIWAYARVDTINEEILRKLKKAGVNWLCYGIEAASTNVRKGVSKSRFNIEQIKKAMQLTHEAGIYIIGNFMFGLPDDDSETMQETLDLAQELNCEYVNFYATMAYPGSQLYEDALEEGIPLPEGWIGFSQFSSETLPLATKHCSAAEVLRFRDEAFVKYYSDPRYLAMIKEKFGEETVEHIREMLKHKIERKILSTHQSGALS